MDESDLMGRGRKKCKLRVDLYTKETIVQRA